MKLIWLNLSCAFCSLCMANEWMWCSAMFLLSEPHSQLSHWVIPMKCDELSEPADPELSGLISEDCSCLMLGQWNWPTVSNFPILFPKQLLLTSILAVFQSLGILEDICCCSSLEGTCLFWEAKTALHNHLLLLPTLHSNYLTECEGMSR